ncbi:formimidoylglutamate deiminase [Martelella alba]|uniref:Formimidoylglutamate deiminase n=1 Tax=Martelella alba TaxID=2590451 RepID=A0ABY2SFF7_9HYPH|nr:formimidoylglutamate deiminase [Martelella alba]TKI03389.1 formimidoylglutamate deiminase [Martelella alba]
MPVYFAARALLPQGWGHHVRLTVDDDGSLVNVETGASADDAIHLAGPVLPAMPNLHSHAFQRAMAGLTEVAGDPQDSFWTWRDVMYRMVRQLNPEQVEIIARQLYIDMLKGGYTQVAEFHYLHNDRDGKPYGHPAEMARHISRAAADAGIGLTLLPVLYSYSGFGARPAEAGQRRFIQDTADYLRQHEALLRHMAGLGTQRLGVCFHSLRAVDERQIAEVLRITSDEMPIHIHVAEQEKEVADCLAWSGKRPVEWLLDHFPVDARWCLIHATHVNQGEVLRLASSGAVAGLCPTTEANLGDGIFPAVDYRARGGMWGVGSDSHVSLNVVEELRWLEYGQRLRDRRRNRIASPQRALVGDNLYRDALAGGAIACGVRLGCLAPGYRADWLVLDGEDPFLQEAEDQAVLNRWLFAGGREQIRDVYVAGRALITEGHHARERETAAAFAGVLRQLRQAAS